MVSGLDCVDANEQAFIESSCQKAQARAQHEAQAAHLFEVMLSDSKHGVPAEFTAYKQCAGSSV